MKYTKREKVQDFIPFQFLFRGGEHPTFPIHVLAQFNQTPSKMPSDIKRLKLLQDFMCFLAVNSVYGNGRQCTTEGKEKLAFIIFEVEIKHYREGTGRWENIADFAKNEFTVEQLRLFKKHCPLTSEKVWERGMISRRGMVPFIAQYGNFINFKVLKPVAEHGDHVKKEQFDVVIDEPSGGSSEEELQKLKLKVT